MIKINQSCENRLFQQLEAPEKRRDAAMTKISQDRRQLKSLGFHDNVQPGRNTEKVRFHKGASSSWCSHEKPDEQYCSNKNHSNQETFVDIRVQCRHNNVQNNGQSVSITRERTDIDSPCPSKRASSSTRQHSLTRISITPASRHRRLIPKPCDYETTNSSSRCQNFPCHQPQTYHSIGFRPDNSSTNEWISWKNLRKAIAINANIAEVRCSSSSGTSIRYQQPEKTESREHYTELKVKSLREETKRQHHLNRSNKLLLWETNCGHSASVKWLKITAKLRPIKW